MSMEYFCAYHSYLGAVQNLSDAECGRLFKACLEYSMTGAEPELAGNERFAFEFIKGDIDRAKAAYQKKCDGNRKNAQRRWEEVDSDAIECERIRTDTIGCERIQGKSKSKSKSKLKAKEDSPNGECTPPKPPKAQPEAVQWAENVTMTNVEHDKLLATYGSADTARLIEILDNYKGSTGKKYKSDYRAILSWCVNRLEEEKAKAKKTAQGRTAHQSWTEIAEEMEAETEAKR